VLMPLEAAQAASTHESPTTKQLFRSFYAYIDAGDFKAPAPFPTFADGHREVLLCEAVLRSARERRWADVEGFHA